MPAKHGALTTAEVAKLCSVAPRTIVRWAEDGILDHWKVPGSTHRRFDPRVVRAFMEKNGMGSLLEDNGG